MVKVTLELLRRRSEHNDGLVTSLEELALHQLGITDLGQLPVWCPRLRILLLQGNLLSHLGKIGRLKELVYLNLALNNLELLPSSLWQCESLNKLDLTANFIRDLHHTVGVLQNLPCLTELYLMGNPVSSYEGYRSYVVASLPGLLELDGITILRHERIKALQEREVSDAAVARGYKTESRSRAQQKAAHENLREAAAQMSDHSEDDEEFSVRWSQEASDHCPETRLSMHEELERRRRRQAEKDGPPVKKEVRLYAKDGRALNVNEAKINFKFTDDEEHNNYKLEVHTYKHLDPSLLQCEVQPLLVRVVVCGKTLQLVLPGEVRCLEATAQRSSTTGHLLVVMPKA
ncbi:dynein axonemal assembly factor 11 [Hyalella azteca]|uniref:Dynein axonemal assembly factor 11 n=1 Tax=Hyalella azteca TaxID=294128 RepID=A0A8B7NWN1_HYAAZ|nr:dynein axonemal assembly factor 11 [Hyalella azteca]